MDIKVDQNTIIIFDLDDTLYNELDYLGSAYIEIAKSLDVNGWKPLFAQMFSLYRCGEDVFGFIANQYGVKKEKLIGQYRNHFPNITPFSGVLDAMNEIRGKKGKIGIITDGRATTQKNKLNALGVSPYLSKVVISEELGTEKPHENNFLAIEEAFPGHRYWYIADNLKKDFITPKARGWQTVGVIDNGKNIHKANHLYLDKGNHLPHGFVLQFSELRFIWY